MFKNRIFSGYHLILDLLKVKADYDMEMVKQIMYKICDDFNLTVCGVMDKQFGDDPKAFTIIFLLAESHFSCHTYPEAEAIAFDLYTCSDMPESILGYIGVLLKEQLHAQSSLQQVIPRRIAPIDRFSWEKYVDNK